MSGQPFDIAQDYIDEAIEMSEIDLNHRSGEGLRADEFPLSSLLAADGGYDADPGVPHGTISGYQYHRCRCDACKLAHRDASRRYRESAKARRAAERTRQRRARERARWHGRQCRCPECVLWEAK